MLKWTGKIFTENSKITQAKGSLMLQKGIFILLILFIVVFVIISLVLFVWPFIAYIAAKYFS